MLYEYDGTTFTDRSATVGFGTESIRALAWDGTYLWIGGAGGGFKRYNPATGEVVDLTTPLGFSEIRFLLFNPVNGQVIIVGVKAGLPAVYSYDGATFVDRSAVAGVPSALTLNPNGDMYFGRNRVYIVKPDWTSIEITTKIFHPKRFRSIWNSGIIATGTTRDVARNMIIDGNYLYAVSLDPQRFAIYDISNPSSPVLKSLTSTGYSMIDIWKKGNYVFISCNIGVLVYDVSDVTAPMLVATVNLADYVHDMFLLGNYLYCCMHTADKFQIIDITNPTSPVVRGSLTGTTYFHGCHSCYVEGTIAYVTNYLASTGEYGLTVVDVSNPDAPAVITGVGEAHKNSAIRKIGNYLYVGSHTYPDVGFTIWDVSTPTSPVYKGRFYVVEGIFYYFCSELIGVTIFERGLYFFDISNPVSPIIHAMCSTVERPKNVVRSGDYVYVSTEDDAYNWRIRSFRLEDAEINTLLFTPAEALENDWLTFASMPTARYDAVAGVVGDRIHVITGYTTTFMTDHEVYNPMTDFWTKLNPIPTGRVVRLTRRISHRRVI